MQAKKTQQTIAPSHALDTGCSMTQIIHPFNQTRKKKKRPRKELCEGGNQAMGQTMGKQANRESKARG
jgi:hypothetical protein